MLKKLSLFFLPLLVNAEVTKTVTVTSCPTTTNESGSGSSDFQTTCLKLVNDFRAKMGVKLLKSRPSKINCSNKEAYYNFNANKFHYKFGMCQEDGQCECKGFNTVDKCINAYISEGPGGGHYELLRSTEFTHLTCGMYKIPNSNGYYYTHNFYNKKPTTTTKTQTPTSTTTTKIPTVTRPTTSTPQPTSNDYITRCLKLVNDFRASLGLQPLVSATQQQIQCANNDAKNDLVRGFHNSFGQCSERGQCECNGYRTIDQCINAYISEGPGGGHYEILKGRYTSLACGTDGNTFYTHNFY